MKLGIFSDIHFHNYKKFDTEGSRLYNCGNALVKIIDKMYSKGIRYILFCGDLYNTPKGLPPVVVNEVVDTFVSVFIQYPDLHFIAISGNHDQPKNHLIGTENNTALIHLHNIFINFHLIDNQSYVIKREDEKDISILGIPYYVYPEDYANMLSGKVQDELLEYGKEVNILLIHQTPDNISNTNIPADFNPDDKIYKKFDKVFCGHIHKHEILNDKVVVVGSPIHRDLSDVGEKKGYLIYDTDTGKVKFKRLKGFPEFSRNRVQASEQDFNVPEEIVLPEALKQDEEIVRNFSMDLKKKKLLKNYLKYMQVENAKELLTVGKKYV